MTDKPTNVTEGGCSQCSWPNGFHEDECPRANDIIERIKQMMADRRNYFDVAGDGVDVLLGDCWDKLEALESQLRMAVEERDKWRAIAALSSDAVTGEGS